MLPSSRAQLELSSALPRDGLHLSLCVLLPFTTYSIIRMPLRASGRPSKLLIAVVPCGAAHVWHEQQGGSRNPWFMLSSRYLAEVDVVETLLMTMVVFVERSTLQLLDTTREGTRERTRNTRQRLMFILTSSRPEVTICLSLQSLLPYCATLCTCYTTSVSWHECIRSSRDA